MPNLARDSRGFSKDCTPTGDSTGLQPYLDHSCKRRAKRARDLDPTKIWATVLIAVACIGYLVIVKWLWL